MALPSPRPLPRAPGAHRPEVDAACAGCGLLGILRALRRARVPADGRLACETGAGPFLAEHQRGEAHLLVLAGPELLSLPPLDGAAVERVDPADLERAEGAVWRALSRRGTTALVAAVPCRLGAPAGPPLAVDPTRCNRCGGCLSLGCPAIADQGGEAMVIDPAVCTGCDRCMPLCRGHAIGRAGEDRR